MVMVGGSSRRSDMLKEIGEKIVVGGAERNGGERISLPRSSVTENEKRARELELGRLTCGEGEVSENSRRRSKTPLSNKPSI